MACQGQHMEHALPAMAAARTNSTAARENQRLYHTVSLLGLQVRQGIVFGDLPAATVMRGLINSLEVARWLRKN